MILLRLFYEFFKTGLFSMGGGLATIPFLSKMSEATGWFTHAELADMIAVSESTPGPVGVNMATYVGYNTYGILGAITATAGLIAPSLIVVLIIAQILSIFRKNRYVETAFYCIRPASTALISAAGLSIAAISFLPVSINFKALNFQGFINSIQWNKVFLALILLACTKFIPKLKDLHPIVWIFFSALIGIIFKIS